MSGVGSTEEHNHIISQERRRIAEWLREKGRRPAHTEAGAWCQFWFREFADAIERGEHAREKQQMVSDDCEEFQASALEVAANPDIGRDCDGTGWYRCRECARWTGGEP